MSRRVGFTLVELLVVAVVLGILMAMVSVFFAQQTRVAGAAQAQNEAEMTARVVAEAVAQDFQLAGSRATVVGGTVTYLDIEPGGCDELNRSRCVLAQIVNAAGEISDPVSGSTINAYALYYRSSLGAPTLCRRVDFAQIGTTLYRSDVACDVAFDPIVAFEQIDLDASIFATNVDDFGVSFECSDGAVNLDPLDCYLDRSTVPHTPTGAYVRQANVTVDVALTGRFTTEASMAMTAFTPNLRPSVNYGRFE